MGRGGGEKKGREESGAILKGGEGNACSTIMAKVVGGYSCEGAY